MDTPRELSEYKNVLQKATQPEKKEFVQIAFVASGGVGLIGVLGLIIYGVMQFFPG